MTNPVKKGGLFIAAAFAIYAAIEWASWYTEAAIWYVTIGGTVLLWMGAMTILKAQSAPKLLVGVTIAVLVLAFILGRVADSMTIETESQLWAFLAVGIAQGMAFTLAGAIALSYRGTTTIRVLCALALASTLAYGWLVSDGLNAILDGSRTFETVRTTLAPAAVLNNLLLLAALVFAFRQPAAPPIPVASANPFVRTAAAPGNPPVTWNAPPQDRAPVTWTRDEKRK